MCTQQSFTLNVGVSSFTLTAPAATYYRDSSPETIQYEYFAFNLAETGGVVQTTAERGSLHSYRDYEVGWYIWMSMPDLLPFLPVQTTMYFFLPAHRY